MAVMHIRYAVVIELEEVTNLFPKKPPKRLELGTLLKDHYDQHHYWIIRIYNSLFIYFYFLRENSDIILILAGVTLQTFYLGKLDLLTVYWGKLAFKLSVTDFSLGNLPRENFIVSGLDMSQEQ